MNSLMKEVTVIAMAIIGLAVLAVFVSNKGNGVGVIKAVSDAFNNSLKAATNPFGG